jgi:hypothetical protein
MSDDQPAALETRGWDALSTSAEAARAFYEQMLDEDVVMILPGSITLDDRSAILDAMSGPPWDDYALDDMQSLQPSPDVGIVLYGAVARRGGEEYSALISSVYVRRGAGWRLVLHQQTPR